MTCWPQVGPNPDDNHQKGEGPWRMAVTLPWCPPGGTQPSSTDWVAWVTSWPQIRIRSSECENPWINVGIFPESSVTRGRWIQGHDTLPFYENRAVWPVPQNAKFKWPSQRMSTLLHLGTDRNSILFGGFQKAWGRGLERWLSGSECFLLFQGTWVQFPAPIPMAHRCLFWSQWVLTCVVYTHMHMNFKQMGANPHIIEPGAGPVLLWGQGWCSLMSLKAQSLHDRVMPEGRTNISLYYWCPLENWVAKEASEWKVASVHPKAGE